MQLTQSMQDFILHWGEMGAKWGTNRSVAQIHALLHLTPNPLPAEEIAETLNMARSNVSGGLKELLSWKLIKVSRQLGDRRDHFIGIEDMVDLVRIVVEGRREREYAPTIDQVRTAIEAAETDKTPPEILARMMETLETMELFDRWYTEISRLPRSTQMTLLKTGAQLARLLPKASS
ncbi:MAG: MarR family transcriptional regulator [Pseudomonadota bacterium]